MTTLQEYLDQQFPTKQKKEQVKKITIGWRDSNLPLTEEQAKELEGEELDLSEYSNLEKIQICGDCLKSPLTKLELGEKPKLIELDCKNNQVTNLDLTNCVNLKELKCDGKLSSNLDITNYPDLKIIFKELKAGYQRFWANINPDFDKIWWDEKTYQQWWEKAGFTCREAEEWVKAGFKLSNCWEIKKWKDENFYPLSVKKWIELGFGLDEAEKAKQWKDQDLAFEQVKEFIKIGFSFSDSWYAKEWLNKGFDSEQTKLWIANGLNPQEIPFAFYLKQKNYQPNQLLANLFQLRKEFYPNAQEYLDQNYPCKCNEDFKKKHLYHEENCPRKNAHKINFRNLNLEGDLDLKRFGDNSLKVYLAGNPQLGKIKNKSPWTEIIYKNPPEFLNHRYFHKNQVKEINLTNLDFEQLGELVVDNYPELKEIGKEFPRNIDNITKITISNCPQLEKVNINNSKNLQQLILNNLPNLSEFNCRGNKLTTLDLTECVNLKKIDCQDNLLTEIKLPSTAGEKLEDLNLGNNSFNQDLYFLSGLVNLKYLYLGNNDHYGKEKINQNIYNKFTGSLDYLSNMKQLWRLDINNTDISEMDIDKLPNSLREVRYSNFIWQRPNCKLTEIIPQLDDWTWKDLHSDFVGSYGELLKNEWQRLGFDKEETEKWIQMGVEPKNPNLAKGWKEKGFDNQQAQVWVQAGIELQDCNFANWLRDGKNLTPQWVFDNKDSKGYKELKKRLDTYNWCRQCKQINTNENLCQPCQEQEWKWDLEQLTGQELVEKFIQQQQLRVTDEDVYDSNSGDSNYYEYRRLQWIPYEQFAEVEHLAEGGFSKIHRAKWIDGPLIDQWGKRERNKVVVLKIINESQNINLEFLTEIANTKLVMKHVVDCYGISQDPVTKDYVMVMHYMSNGNLRQYLQNKTYEPSFLDKLRSLSNVSYALENIHQKNLVHRDFHSGNILGSGWHISITDLGLSQPANHQKEESKIFGVLPYVAPEVLQGEPYTKASDIYSFGIIAYEWLANAYPYVDSNLDAVDLASAVCRGLRPNLEEVKIPPLLKDLIKKCWDTDPEKRPIAEELEKIISNWFGEIVYKKNTQFDLQYQEIKDEYNHFSQNAPYKINPKIITHSRPINTKQIAELVKNLQKTEESPSQAIEITKQSKLENEIKQIKEQKGAELAKLIEDFIQAFKKKEGGDQEAKNEVKKLDKELGKNLPKEDIKKIIEYCKELVNLERQQSEKKVQTEAKIQQTNLPFNKNS